MEISIADQIALDDALVAPADRLKIGKCNLRLSSDITSKEATLQVVYDVLKLTPFYKFGWWGLYYNERNFKKDATLKLFKNGMSMSVQKSQVHKMAKLQDGVEIVLG
ncbi:hypothetical protein Tco_1509700 [Tanacetum coccineum]